MTSNPDELLKIFCAAQIPVYIFLNNGTKITGTIQHFTDTKITLRDKKLRTQMIIFNSNIASIVMQENGG